MENQVLDDGLHNGTSLELHSLGRDYLLQTSKWAKFLAILGFVFSGLIILLGLFFGSLFSSLGGAANMPSGVSSFVGVFYAIMGGIMFYPALRLYQFAQQARVAVDYNNNDALQECLRRMRSVFRFYGILMIIYLGFIALALLFALVGLAST